MTNEQFGEIAELKKLIDSNESKLETLKLIKNCPETNIKISAVENPFFSDHTYRFELDNEDSKMCLKLFIQHIEDKLISLKEIFENIQIKINANLQ